MLLSTDIVRVTVANIRTSGTCLRADLFWTLNTPILYLHIYGRSAPCYTNDICNNCQFSSLHWALVELILYKNNESTYVYAHLSIQCRPCSAQ